MGGESGGDSGGANCEFGSYVSRLLAAAASCNCDFTTSRATSVERLCFSVFLTNLVIKKLHFISTSSRKYRPEIGTPRPISTGCTGSPGKLPPKDHFSLISSPIGAYTCVCRPYGRSWKQALKDTFPVYMPAGRYDTLSVIWYQVQWYSSGVASGGGLMRWRSSCEGLRSIISVCVWSVASTVSFEMPAGRGVMVVNIVFFDIIRCRM